MPAGSPGHGAPGAGGGAARSYRLAELAAAIGGEVVGDPEVTVRGVRTLEHAGASDLSFVTSGAFRQRAASSQAAALLVSPALAADRTLERPKLVARHPKLALARILALFHPLPAPSPGIHPTAVVGQGCEIDPSSHVAPYAVIGDGSRLGARSVVGAHAVIGSGCVIGDDAVLHPHVVLYDSTEIGARVVLHAGVVLGADGFGYASQEGEHVKIPQVGRTVIEADVEVGALSAVDRALLEETRVGAGTKIDNLVQVGHNVRIGRGCLLCGQAGVAGSARLGDFVVLGGQSGAADNVEVARGVQAAGKSAILRSIPEEGLQVAGIPAVDLKRWRRQRVRLERLDQLARRVRALEKRLEKIGGD